MGFLIIAGLVIKERLVQRVAVRHVITFLVFMVVTWFSWFCLNAIYKPLFEVLGKIG